MTPEAQTGPNRARDHLANERTYLAWIRTAVALIGFGVITVRLRYLLPPSPRNSGYGWELGFVFGLAGLGTVLFATSHYFHVQRAIENDSYEPEKRWVIVCSVVIMLVGAGVLYYLFTAPTGPSPPTG